MSTLLAMLNKWQLLSALGTPTPNTPTSHVAHLQPLLAFLGHDPYGTQRNMWLVGPHSLPTQLFVTNMCHIQNELL